MHSNGWALGVLLLMLLACGCSPARDAPPLRVVSLTPLGTRALEVLGFAEAIVAADPESRALLGPSIPETELHDAAEHRPDLVFVGASTPPDPAALEALRNGGAEILEIAPRQLDEALLLYEALATRLGDRQRGLDVSRRIGDPYARRSTRSFGRPRPCVAVVVALSPWQLAGGHSFETNLVEIVGGESLSHDHDRSRVPGDPEALRRAAPDLVLVATRRPLPEAIRDDLRLRLAPLPTAFTTLDPDALWLGDSAAVLQSWAELVDAVRPESGDRAAGRSCRAAGMREPGIR